MATIEQQFVEYAVKSLVEYPDDVVVEHIVDDKGILLTLTVNPEDLGRVIGRRGATAQSLRTLLRALGTKNNERYNLKIVNNDEPEQTAAPAVSNDDADDTSTVASSDDSDDAAASDEAVESYDTTTNEVEDVQPVDNSADESVENDTDGESDYARKSRLELAELDDLDI